ncbi:hypothetical protein T265_05660 [Opisthorchis viverrini]|uniref:Uncharacterized protein n=1 Tax=Opisthorchis viverrini TaxID=6198 RepID=A0A074ZJS6_OPIVI|nr:hypothetical protein T265_05660 [Opisthorchis viverrini]KER27256.1 hypothetical protein T265_05660 [Opisthorchis viverrini]
MLSVVIRPAQFATRGLSSHSRLNQSNIDRCETSEQCSDSSGFTVQLLALACAEFVEVVLVTRLPKSPSQENST